MKTRLNIGNVYKKEALFVINAAESPQLQMKARQSRHELNPHPSFISSFLFFSIFLISVSLFIFPIFFLILLFLSLLQSHMNGMTIVCRRMRHEWNDPIPVRKCTVNKKIEEK